MGEQDLLERGLLCIRREEDDRAVVLNTEVAMTRSF